MATAPDSLIGWADATLNTPPPSGMVDSLIGWADATVTDPPVTGARASSLVGWADVTLAQPDVTKRPRLVKTAAGWKRVPTLTLDGTSGRWR